MLQAGHHTRELQGRRHGQHRRHRGRVDIPRAYVRAHQIDQESIYQDGDGHTFQRTPQGPEVRLSPLHPLGQHASVFERFRQEAHPAGT